MQLGDARSGKLSENLAGFGRMLRRAGLAVDSTRIGLAQQALSFVDIGSRQEVYAALSSTLVNRQEDLQAFSDLFDAYFRNPEIAKQLMAQLLPQAKAQNKEPTRSARAQEALQAPRPKSQAGTKREEEIQLDAAMSASDRARLRHADFNQLSASEFRLVERLAREVSLQAPSVASRRRRYCQRGDRVHWGKLLQFAARHDGDFLAPPLSARRQTALPLLVLVDVSGSMERYARLMLAYLHQSLRNKRSHVFTFGTHLTDLSPAFKQSNTDTMLALANASIADFGGGTKLGEALKALRAEHARAIVGNRTIVLLITDGLDTGHPEDLEQELAWLTRQAKATVWLNPLLRYDQYQPLAGGARTLTKYVDSMLAIHNLEHLSALAQALQQLMKKIR